MRWRRDCWQIHIHWLLLWITWLYSIRRRKREGSNSLNLSGRNICKAICVFFCKIYKTTIYHFQITGNRYQILDLSNLLIKSNSSHNPPNLHQRYSILLPFLHSECTWIMNMHLISNSQSKYLPSPTNCGVTLDPTPVPQPNIFKLLMPDNEELVGTLYVCYSIGMVCSLF